MLREPDQFLELLLHFRLLPRREVIGRVLVVGLLQQFVELNDADLRTKAPVTRRRIDLWSLQRLIGHDQPPRRSERRCRRWREWERRAGCWPGRGGGRPQCGRASSRRRTARW